LNYRLYCHIRGQNQRVAAGLHAALYVRNQPQGKTGIAKGQPKPAPPRQAESSSIAAKAHRDVEFRAGSLATIHQTLTVAAGC
jgi:hypothetical protein